MAALVYSILLLPIYAISLLPFRLLYILSDFFYVIIYKVIGYRKKVVHTNLQNAFPEKTEKEIKIIQDKFYRYFCDLVLETIKTLTISPKTLSRHVTFTDLSIFKQYYEQNKSIIIVMGHLGNWEIGGAKFSQIGYHPLYVLYHPISNKYFDKLMYRMRTRLGNKLYAMKDALRGMLTNKNKLTATAFIADQTPPPKGAYWTQFLNQDTPVFVGTAKIAKKLNYPVIYVSIKRSKRGYYEIDSELLTENPGLLSEDEISELHTRKLEKDIKENPEIWLWTHRRWKHKKPIE